jgi:hypothetical protein
MSTVSKLKHSPLGLVPCLLALLMMALLPAPAAAKVFLGGPGVGEGDPVDSNDLGNDGATGGGGTDDDIDDALSVMPSPEPVLPWGLEFLRIIVVPTGTGALPFQVLFIVDQPLAAVEGAYAR